MTAWELQLAANARGKATTAQAWVTAALYRSKKLDPLEDMLDPYDSFKLGGEAAQRASFDGIFQMMAAASAAQKEREGSE